MSYAYNWQGHPTPAIRAASVREMGDWPPVINSGPERGVNDGMRVPMRLRSGQPPAGQRNMAVGDVSDALTSIPVLLALGAAAYFMFRKPKRPPVRVVHMSQPYSRKRAVALSKRF